MSSFEGNQTGNSNETQFNITVNCPVYSDYDVSLLNGLGFWMEGVVQSSIAISGILFNLFSSFILAAKDMRNSFNLLLIALALFDTCYLFGSILESFRKSFKLITNVHTLMFPYFLYPGQMIMMTASVFMTVAIAMERYVAVHYPLDYNQSMNNENAILRRVLKYVVPVITFSITFNIPKFFEAQIDYYVDKANVTVPALIVSELRKNPDYTYYYNNCARLIVLGIVPFVLLVFFNTKIYQDIQVRRKRRCPRPPSSNSNSGERNIANNGNTSIAVPATNVAQASSRKGSQHKRQQNANRRRYEDNLAVIFMGIVLFFLISHLPRILMGIHEVFVSQEANECMKHHKAPFAVWVHIVTHVSHLLLVINGSVNSLIYCCFSSRFRAQVVKYMHEFAEKLGLNKNNMPRSGVTTNVNGFEEANRLKSSVSINGVRPSLNMTTFGKSEDAPLIEKRNGLTQTTQV